MNSQQENKVALDLLMESERVWMSSWKEGPYSDDRFALAQEAARLKELYVKEVNGTFKIEFGSLESLPLANADSDTSQVGEHG